MQTNMDKYNAIRRSKAIEKKIDAGNNHAPVRKKSVRHEPTIASVYSFAVDLITANPGLAPEEAMHRSFALLTQYQDKLDQYHASKSPDEDQID